MRPWSSQTRSNTSWSIWRFASGLPHEVVEDLLPAERLRDRDDVDPELATQQALVLLRLDRVASKPRGVVDEDAVEAARHRIFDETLKAWTSIGSATALEVKVFVEQLKRVLVGVGGRLDGGDPDAVVGRRRSSSRPLQETSTFSSPFCL
jgi:hypothetical protein